MIMFICSPPRIALRETGGRSGERARTPAGWHTRLSRSRPMGHGARCHPLVGTPPCLQASSARAIASWHPCPIGRCRMRAVSRCGCLLVYLSVCGTDIRGWWCSRAAAQQLLAENKALKQEVRQLQAATFCPLCEADGGSALPAVTVAGTASSASRNTIVATATMPLPATGVAPSPPPSSISADGQRAELGTLADAPLRMMDSAAAMGDAAGEDSPVEDITLAASVASRVLAAARTDLPATESVV